MQKNQFEQNDNIDNDKKNNPPIDIVYTLFMKTYFYLGIFGAIPYFFLHFSPSELTNIAFNPDKFLLFFTIIALFVLLLMDLIGMNTSYLDRISRLITLILTIIAGICSIFLFFYTKTSLLYCNIQPL